MWKRPKIALALGGGAARGLAHLGVLRILEEEGIPIDMIVGTSMGALVGAMYAAHPNAERVLGHVSRVLNSPEFRQTKIHQLRRSANSDDTGLFDGFAEKIQRGILYGSTMTRRSIIPEEEVTEFIVKLVDDIDITDTQIPFGAVATNLRTGEGVLFQKGSIREVTAASCAVPLAFPPVTIGEDEMLDGGMVSMVPVMEAHRMGADFVLAVNISASLSDYEELSRGYRILFRTMEITKNALLQAQLQPADFILAPDVGRVHWADFSSWKTCIELGEHEALENISRLRRRIRARRFGFGKSRKRRS